MISRINEASNQTAMAFDPANNGRVGFGSLSTAPQLRFYVNVNLPDQYTLWVRSASPGQTGYLYYGLNGAAFGNSISWSSSNSYSWKSGTVGNFNIGTPGVYVINLWMDRANIRVDKIVLTTSGKSPSRTGPTQSSFSDLDECTLNLDNCDNNARCLNVFGSFQCSCNLGYIGTGVNCILAVSITCPRNIVQGNDPTRNSAVITYSNPVTTGVISSVTLVTGLTSGSSFPIGVTNVTYRAQDVNGFIATCSFFVTVSDIEPPSIICPNDIITATNPGSAVATVAYAIPVATDNVAAVVTLVNGPPPTTPFALGDTFVQYRASDPSGNSKTCVFTVTVRDVEPPVIACPPAITVPTDAGSARATVVYSFPNVTDNAPNPRVNLTLGLPSGSIFSIGTTTVGYRVIDYGGNTDSCTFTVTIVDLEPPTVSCPLSLVLSGSANQNGAFVLFTYPQASDNSQASISIVQLTGVPPSLALGGQVGATFPFGFTNQSYSAIDLAGNTAFCWFTVNVQDIESPTITCPANITVPVDRQRPFATVTYVAPVGVDNSGVVTTTQLQGGASGDSFPLGSTTNVFRAVDGNANTATCSFTINVVDSEPPTISCPASLTFSSIAQLVVNYSLPTFSDNLAGTTIALRAGLPSGAPFPLGTTTVTYTARDLAGNTANCSFTVYVADAGDLTIVCPANIEVGTDVNSQFAVVNYSSPVGVGGLNPQTSRTAGLASGSSFPIGTQPITFTVVDGSFSSSCTFSITVRDIENPVMVCPADIDTSTAPGQPFAAVTYSQPIVTDNVPNVVTRLLAGLPSGSAFPSGVTVVTYQALDLANNQANCSFTVNVRDLESPRISCPANVTLSTNPGLPTALVFYSTPLGQDNVNCTTTLLQGAASGSPFMVGTTQVAYQATDASGNVATCFFFVTVVDTEPPTITCPSSFVTTMPVGQFSILLNYNLPVARDNVQSSVSMFLTAGQASGTNFTLGDTLITYQVQDRAGFTASCSFSVTVLRDAGALFIACPADVITSTSPGAANASVTFPSPIPAGGVGNVTVRLISPLPSGSFFPIGISTVTYQAQDYSTTFNCSFTITIVDTELPVVVCPPDQFVTPPVGFAQVQVSYPPANASDNSGAVAVSLFEGAASGSFFFIGVNLITFRASDAANNTIYCSFSIVVTNNATISCPSNITRINDRGQAYAVITYGDVVARGVGVSFPQLVAGKPSSSIFFVGVTVQTYRVQDSFGNAATCSFSITVIDAEAPVITCPNNITVGNDAHQTSAVMNYSLPIATDNVPGTATIALLSGIGSGGVFPLGLSAEQYIATDASGLSAVCTFYITVQDTEKPTIVCPNNISVDGQNSSYIVYYPPATASDNLGVVRVEQLSGLASGSSFPAGISYVTYRATDVSNLTSACSFSIYIAPLPTVTISGPRSAFRNQDVLLTSVLYPSPLAAADTEYAFQWTVRNVVTQQVVPVVPANRTIILVSKYTLAPGVTYSFTLTVDVISRSLNTSRQVSFQYRVDIDRFPLTVYIEGGDRQMAPNQRLDLQAIAVDPDIVGTSYSLQYIWNVSLLQPNGVPGDITDSTLGTAKNFSSVAIPPNSFGEDKELNFSVFVSSNAFGIVTSAQATVTIKTTKTGFLLPTVILSQFPQNGNFINPQNTLRLVTNVIDPVPLPISSVPGSYYSYRYGFQWSSPTLNLNSSYVTSSLNSPVFVCQPGFLQAGTTYRFQVTVLVTLSLVDSAGTSKDIQSFVMGSGISITVNTPPIPGTCIVTPNNVPAFTAVSIVCSDWIDVDTGTSDDIQYSFSYKSFTSAPIRRLLASISSDEVVLTAPSFYPSASVLLPPGNHQLIAHVYSKAGASASFAFGPVAVSAVTGTPCSINNLINGTLLQLQQLGNNDQILQMVKLVISVLSDPNSKLNTAFFCNGTLISARDIQNTVWWQFTGILDQILSQPVVSDTTVTQLADVLVELVDWLFNVNSTIFQDQKAVNITTDILTELIAGVSGRRALLDPILVTLSRLLVVVSCDEINTIVSLIKAFSANLLNGTLPQEAVTTYITAQIGGSSQRALPSEPLTIVSSDGLSIQLTSEMLAIGAATQQEQANFVDITVVRYNYALARCRTGSDGKAPSGDIISIEVGNGNISNLDPPFVFYLPINEISVPPTKECIAGSRNTTVATCSWWDFATETWNSDGCKSLGTTIMNGKPAVKCACTHLTDFAVLYREVSQPCFMYDSTPYRIAALVYLVLGTLALIQLIRVARSHPKLAQQKAKCCRLEMEPLVIQHGLILIVCILRAVSAARFGHVILGSGSLASLPVWSIALITSLPYLVSFWIFSLLVWQWARLYHIKRLANADSDEKLKPYFLSLNFAVFLITLAFLLSFVVPGWPLRETTIIASFLMSLIYVIASIIFLLYAILIYKVLNESKYRRSHSLAERETVPCAWCFTLGGKMLLTGTVVSLCFLGETLVWAGAAWAVEESNFNQSDLTFAFFILDIVALLSVLVVFARAIKVREVEFETKKSSSEPPIASGRRRASSAKTPATAHRYSTAEGQMSNHRSSFASPSDFPTSVRSPGLSSSQSNSPRNQEDLEVPDLADMPEIPLGVDSLPPQTPGRSFIVLPASPSYRKGEHKKESRAGGHHRKSSSLSSVFHQIWAKLWTPPCEYCGQNVAELSCLDCPRLGCIPCMSTSHSSAPWSTHEIVPMGDSPQHGNISGQQEASPSVAAGSSPSLNNNEPTLMQVLDDPARCSYLCQFVEQGVEREALVCYLAIVRYREKIEKKGSGDFISAWKIFTSFLKPGAPFQVNVPPAECDRLETALRTYSEQSQVSGENLVLDGTEFDEIQYTLVHQIHEKIWPKFKESAEWVDMLRAHSADGVEVPVYNPDAQSSTLVKVFLPKAFGAGATTYISLVATPRETTQYFVSKAMSAFARRLPAGSKASNYQLVLEDMTPLFEDRILDHFRGQHWPNVVHLRLTEVSHDGFQRSLSEESEEKEPGHHKGMMGYDPSSEIEMMNMSALKQDRSVYGRDSIINSSQSQSARSPGRTPGKKRSPSPSKKKAQRRSPSKHPEPEEEQLLLQQQQQLELQIQQQPQQQQPQQPQQDVYQAEVDLDDLPPPPPALPEIDLEMSMLPGQSDEAKRAAAEFEVNLDESLGSMGSSIPAGFELQHGQAYWLPEKTHSHQKPHMASRS